MKKLLIMLSLAAAAFAQAADRLIAIDGSLTEIVYALDEGDNLVARDDTAIYPVAARTLPSVGYMRALSAEGILSVKPSRILLTSAAGPKPVLDHLAKSGIDMIRIDTEDSLEGVREKISRVGEALGEEEKTSVFLKSYDEKVAQLAANLKANGERLKGKKALVFLAMQANQLNAAGQSTKAQAVLDALGLENAVDHQGYKPISKESLLALDPDVVIVATHGRMNAALLSQQFGQIRAFREGKVLSANSAELLSFGPRLPDALLALSGKISAKPASH